ncbi:UNVERIFIED_CONTAM: hypothetical protein FKN15_054531 [Acipenser sinensis]
MDHLRAVYRYLSTGVDLIGPFQPSKGGNRYSLTATDFFTKWTEAIPIKDKSAACTASALANLFYCHGAPEIVLRDQGGEFWKKNWGIQHRISSAYHPQTNGLDERTNQTIKRATGKSLAGMEVLKKNERKT